MTDPLFHAGLLAAETLILLLVVRFANRARTSAGGAYASERRAWLSERDAARHADRAEGTLPPDVIPFPVEIEKPKVNDADFLGPRLARLPEDDQCCS